MRFIPRLISNADRRLTDDLVIDVEADLAAAFGLSPLEQLAHEESEKRHRLIDERNASAERIRDLRSTLTVEEARFTELTAAIEICSKAEQAAKAGKLPVAAE